MAEQETAQDTTPGETAEQEYQYNIQIEETGPATKKVTIDIPEERIKAKLDEQFNELRREAAIPGFRPGHVPRKLLEKRFASDVRDQVRRNLVTESYEQAMERNKLSPMGEPEFEDVEKIKLPDTGSFVFTFTVEVQPQFELPDLAGMTIKKPKVDVSDANVDQAVANLREQQGALVPVEERGVQTGDYLTADVHVKVDGNVIAHQHDGELVARPGRVASLNIEDLDKQLEGLKPGETRTVKVHAPETHPNEQFRNKDVEIEVALKDIKKMELAEMTPAFLSDLGFTNEQELREALRLQMIQRLQYDIQEAMRNQVRSFLLDNVSFELPAKLSSKQTERVISRRYIEMMTRGVSRDQIEANIERLRHGAADEAARELKLFFVLQKLAEKLEVDVDEPELNGRIAMLAIQRNRRPEKLKQEMASDGSLATLFIQMREQKAIDEVLKTAKVEEVDMSAMPAEAKPE